MFGNVTTAKAEVNVLYASQLESVAAYTEKTFTFESPKEAALLFAIEVASPVDMQLALYDSTGALVQDTYNPLTIYSNDSDWYVNSYGNWEYDAFWNAMPAGDYTYGVTFAENTQFYLTVVNGTEDAKISEEKATITKGFTKKLYVSNGTVTKWSSSKKSVATVDKNGKVTAKKSGKATITATLSDGSKVKCAVTVKDNKYSATKITSSDVSYNEYGAKAYSASFDKNGNLVVKIMIVNGGYGKMTKIPCFKVTVKNQDGKTVGTYKKSSFSVSVPSYASKSYSVTIKKSSKLSSKKTDLRNSPITVDGGTATVYY